MERTPAQKAKQWLAISVAVGATVLVGGWEWVLNSEPYAVASTSTRSSPEVAKSLGPVKDISLRTFNISLDDAYFRMAVEGANAKGTVTVSLKKDPAWRVDQVSVNR
jgi:hypothetical protein